VNLEKNGIPAYERAPLLAGRFFPKSGWKSMQWHREWAILNPTLRSHHFPSAKQNNKKPLSIPYTQRLSNL